MAKNHKRKHVSSMGELEELLKDNSVPPIENKKEKSIKSVSQLIKRLAEWDGSVNARTDDFIESVSAQHASSLRTQEALAEMAMQRELNKTAPVSEVKPSVNIDQNKESESIMNAATNNTTSAQATPEAEATKTANNAAAPTPVKAEAGWSLTKKVTVGAAVVATVAGIGYVVHRQWFSDNPFYVKS